jgi:ATP-binding protein involved in chromosome partitioning
MPVEKVYGKMHKEKIDLPGIKHLIAVASGKGGVGKSTTSVNLALALQSINLKVGLFDSDIYGPSIPTMMNLKGKPEMLPNKSIKPMESFGIQCMSMGLFLDKEDPVIWRGPMIMGAIQQMLKDVDWGELDVMIIDLPPGTGDAQLTLSQNVRLTGAVIVSTPQDIALIDARKGLKMFQKVNVPILGIIENMSYFEAPDTGKKYFIFGDGGAKREAEKIGIDFLGQIPLDIAIREKSDEGNPIYAHDKDHPQSKIYRDIANQVWKKISDTS